MTTRGPEEIEKRLDFLSEQHAMVLVHKVGQAVENHAASQVVAVPLPTVLSLLREAATGSYREGYLQGRADLLRDLEWERSAGG